MADGGSDALLMSTPSVTIGARTVTPGT